MIKNIYIYFLSSLSFKTRFLNKVQDVVEINLAISSTNMPFKLSHKILDNALHTTKSHTSILQYNDRSGSQYLHCISTSENVVFCTGCHSVHK